MIRKLRTRLVVVCMLSLLLVIAVILGVVLATSYQGVVSDADRVLALLAENEGEFPVLKEDFDWEALGPRRQSQELGYEIRYFSVLLDETGAVVETDTGQIAAVDEETAVDYAVQILAQDTQAGFLKDYRYLISQEGTDTRVIFLDCGASMVAFRSTLFTSLWVAAVGLAAVLFLILLFSRRLVRPLILGYEKQKRFITDAGHEIKTPIAIIQADSEVLALESGENEWIQDIQHQIRRLSSLTNDLIYLSRMEEDQGRGKFLPLSLSQVVTETAQAFQTMAKSQNKSFTIDVQPGLAMEGEEKALGQLVSVLLDNALKYAPEGGEIALALARQGKYFRLTVENTAQGITKELLENLFDRFYRGDVSRDSSQGGYGIGLSIARAVVQAHRGKISAVAKGEDKLLIAVLLPMNHPLEGRRGFHGWQTRKKPGKETVT
ncbi:MAG: HAMP domain-containing histidine kinase [Clostridiales bacterium]|nr:HAMP domain-containing histidine kinase [Clostridiales bacterium]